MSELIIDNHKMEIKGRLQDKWDELEVTAKLLGYRFSYKHDHLGAKVKLSSYNSPSAFFIASFSFYIFPSNNILNYVAVSIYDDVYSVTYTDIQELWFKIDELIGKL